jgi:hypothetical protein
VHIAIRYLDICISIVTIDVHFNVCTIFLSIIGHVNYLWRVIWVWNTRRVWKTNRVMCILHTVFTLWQTELIYIRKLNIWSDRILMNCWTYQRCKKPLIFFIVVSWVVMPCSLARSHQHFRETCHFHFSTLRRKRCYFLHKWWYPLTRRHTGVPTPEYQNWHLYYQHNLISHTFCLVNFKRWRTVRWYMSIV